jgi:hypothetical protein
MGEIQLPRWVVAALYIVVLGTPFFLGVAVGYFLWSL